MQVRAAAASAEAETQVESPALQALPGAIDTTVGENADVTQEIYGVTGTDCNTDSKTGTDPPPGSTTAETKAIADTAAAYRAVLAAAARNVKNPVDCTPAAATATEAILQSISQTLRVTLCIALAFFCFGSDHNGLRDDERPASDEETQAFIDSAKRQVCISNPAPRAERQAIQWLLSTYQGSRWVISARGAQ